MCKEIVKVRRKSIRVIVMVLMFREEIVRVICVYGSQSGGTMAEKQRLL